MSTSGYALLRLSGSIDDHLVITAALGVQPTATHKKGDRVGNSQITRKCDSWVYKEPLVGGHDVASAAAAVISAFKDRLREIAELCQSLSLEVDLECVVYTDMANPGLHFTAAVIRACADMGASLDIDIYALEEDQDAKGCQGGSA